MEGGYDYNQESTYYLIMHGHVWSTRCEVGHAMLTASTLRTACPAAPGMPSLVRTRFMARRAERVNEEPERVNVLKRPLHGYKMVQGKHLKMLKLRMEYTLPAASPCTWNMLHHLFRLRSDEIGHRIPFLSALSAGRFP